MKVITDRHGLFSRCFVWNPDSGIDDVPDYGAGFTRFITHSPEIFDDWVVGELFEKKTILLDLSKSEEELWAGLSSACRRKVKLAERSGVGCGYSSDTNNLDLYRMYSRFYRDRGLVPWSYDSFNKCMLFFSELNGNVLSGGVLVHDGECAFYVIGFSNDRKFGNGNALVWEMIKYAKEQGCTLFDFGGCDDSPGNRGNKKFKLSFGGVESPVFHYDVSSKFYRWMNNLRRVLG